MNIFASFPFACTLMYLRLQSVCMMLLHRDESISVPEKLRFANTIVAEFIEGRREFIPRLG